MIKLVISVLLLLSSLSAKPLHSSDEELRLMLQSFLYVNDLEYAYKTAKIGYRKNPKSYYWNQKMAEISRWSGRGTEAIKYMKFMYASKHSPKIRDEIINYGLSAYQYENIANLIVQKALKNPTQENIKQMIFVYSEIGSPEKSAHILEKEAKKYPKNEIYLSEALQIYLDMGELKDAKRVIAKIQERGSISSKNAERISYYYFITKDVNAAYETLSHVDEKDADVKYYELRSDLGWYLQKYEEASSASLKLYEMKKARLVDYERIAETNKEDNLALVGDVALAAYNEYKVSYLFYGFANYALSTKQYDLLSSDIKEYDDLGIIEESNYWLIKAQLYSHYKENTLAIEALRRALELEPNNMQTQLSIIYFYIDNGFVDELTLALDALYENENLSSNFYFPMASSYYYIQDINRAAYFVEMAHEEEVPVISSVDFKFLEAYIYQIRNNENAFILKLREIMADLKGDAKKEPTLLIDDLYLNNYLSAGMNLWSADKFEKKLKEAKPYLSRKNYDNLAYSWATNNSENEKSNEIYHKIDKRELWMQFSNAMLEQNHSETENLLDAYIKLLPLGDASFAAGEDGQIALAQTLAYEALNKNSDNQNAYIAHLNLVKQRSDLLSVKPSYYSRNPLKQEYLSLENRTYLSRDYYLYSRLNYYMNESIDKAVLLTVPEETIEFGFGLKKVFARGFAELDLQYNDSMAQYLSYKLSGEYKFNTYFTAGMTLGHNIRAEESTQLLLGGKKDMLELKLLWSLLPSTSLEYLYEHNLYSSQNEVNLGEGDYSRATLSYQIRNGYPDMRVGTFVDKGEYAETQGSRGDIDLLQGPNLKALPENFYNVGLNFSYGMVNSEIYTRVWRPYFEASTYHNSFTDDISYGLNLGYGGKVNEQDHLVFGATYTESVNGIGGSVFELFMRYQLLYISP